MGYVFDPHISNPALFNVSLWSPSDVMCFTSIHAEPRTAPVVVFDLTVPRIHSFFPLREKKHTTWTQYIQTTMIWMKNKMILMPL